MDARDLAILERLRKADLTTEQLAARLGLRPNTIAVRMTRLVRDGHVLVVSSSRGTSGQRTYRAAPKSE
jgi:DNA-binding Lrp family transcriptional regulator